VRAHERTEGNEGALLIAHPQEIDVVESCALPVEQLKDYPIHIQRGLDLAAPALGEGDRERALNILHADAVAVGLVA
jgi:hypothetical protein